MASFNSSINGADVLSSTVAAGNTGTHHHNIHHNQHNHHNQYSQHYHNSQQQQQQQQQQTFHNHNHHQQHHQHHQHHHHHQHFERSATTVTNGATAAAAAGTAATAFLVPASSSGLQFDSPFLTATSHFVSPNSHTTAAAANTSTASYTFLQIKREPCQVSEVTTSNNNCHTTHHHNIGGGGGGSGGGCGGIGVGFGGGTIATAQSSSTASSSSSSSSSSAAAAAAALATSLGLASASATSKTMSSSSTLTTLVKIEASSPKVHELDKSHAINAIGSNIGNTSNNSVPIGIAVARKRPQESTVPPSSLSTIPSLSSGLADPSALPLTQSLTKDMNCFGIRVADLAGVGTGCSNIYFTGNTDLMTGSATVDELGLNAASLQSVNRAPSTFWQYSNALPIESVISMSPATVGLQYSREPNRGQVVLLPATATPLDPFQQAAAAAFVWPSYIPQGSASATLQPPPNFIFPSMSPHSTLQATAAPSYATSLQLLGSNYLTAAAAAAAAAAATSTLCQHNQQTNSTSSSINLSLGNTPSGGTSSTMSTSSSSSSTTRFMSLAATAQPLNDLHQTKSQTQSKALVPAPATLTLTTGPTLVSPAQPPPLLLPPSALKLEEWSTGEFMATAAKTTTTTLTAAAAITGPSAPTSSVPSVQFETRDKLTTTTTTTNGTTNIFEVPSPAQALNLVRLPTPPASANLDTASVAASCTPHLQHQLLFQTAANSSPTPSLLNLSATLNRVNGISSSANSITTAPSTSVMTVSTSLLNSNSSFINGGHNCPTSTLTPTVTPGTPLSTEAPINFKISNLDTTPQIVVGVPRVVHQTTIPTMGAVGAPQMQDVNIQTDTPVCSEDENSICPLTMQQQQQLHQQQVAVPTTIPEASIQCTPPLEPTDEVYDDTNVQHPLELIKSHNKDAETTTQLNVVPNIGMLDNTHKCLDKSLVERHEEKCNGIASVCNSNSTNNSNTQSQSNLPEDLTGLELLSNISTSSLIKSGIVRVKQEPVDHVNEANVIHTVAGQSELSEANQNHFSDQQKQQQQREHQSVQYVSSQTQRQTTPPPSPQQSQIRSPNHETCNVVSPVNSQGQTSNIVEPLGGLKLLCALAEQRIQEEEEVQNKPLNGDKTNNSANSSNCNNNSHNSNNNVLKGSSTSISNVVTNTFIQPPSIVTTSSVAGSTSYDVLNTQNTSFPSMQGIELPSPSDTRYVNLNGDTIQIETKRKKRKHHSKSSKSSSSGGSSKKSARSSKKNKKKKRHKLLATGDCSTTDLDFNDPHLQQELQKAFQTAVDPNYQRLGKWPSAQEIFNIMESNMRMRLAEITRQYRKKKRKLEEISKSKKKSKCSQLSGSSSSPVISLVGNASLTLAAAASAANGTVTSSVTGGTSHHLSSSPLCDYKFGNFSAKPLKAAGTGTNYLTSTSFLRFADTQSQSIHPQFPPPDLELDKDTLYTPNNNNNNNHFNNNNNNSNNNNNNSTSTPIYKPVRLEPSSLTATVDQRTSGSILRLAQKTSSSLSATKLPKMVVCKESILKTRHESESDNKDIDTGNMNKMKIIPQKDNIQQPKHHQHHHQQQQQSLTAQTTAQSCSNLIDQSLMLTQEHLYRKETRVLTDMGGLFYAGIMKPLQPPDVYAITLDGERGNKSHIMSREEIFKDTILEVAPKTVESVPVGTRLCAYWSQQYRCLYPGRAIESESSDDGAIAQEFVSVEFDDGDSGRIRLQNIRFLLSDYPIVEYNDNPLYSLGKHKKNSSKTTIGGEGGGAGVDADDEDTLQQQQHHQHQHHQQAITSTSISSSKCLNNDAYSATAQEIFAAKRSEKKRNKSLKKRSENNMNTISNGCVTSSSGIPSTNSPLPMIVNTMGDCGGGGVGVGVGSGSGHKHHKHKKHKKHKKHHHRKNLMGIGIVAKCSLNNNEHDVNNDGDDESNINPPIYTASFVHKCEQNFVGQNISTQEQQEEEHEPEEGQGEDDDEMEDGQQSEHNYKIHSTHRASINEDSRMADDEVHITRATTSAAAATTTTATTTSTAQSTTIKMESTVMQNVKVKTERFDLDEDESTSNQMSEISDETKGDHNNSKGSKIAAFLPDRQLWGWMGNAHRRAGAKGKARKQFYKTIKRGKETISVGDCAVFLSTGRPDRPFIGNIESMWETKTKIKRVRVKWFYHPEEAKGCPQLKYPGALFESPHVDQNDVQTISHRCEVLPFESYVKKFGTDPKQYQSIYDNNDTYYLAGKYLPIPGSTKVFSNIPLAETETNMTISSKAALPPSSSSTSSSTTQSSSAAVTTTLKTTTATTTTTATGIATKHQQNAMTATSNTQKKRKQQQTLHTTKTKITILNNNVT